MAIQEPVEFSTRAVFRDDLERNLTTLLKDAERKVEGGSWDGVPVVTRKDLDEAIAAVFDAPLPPPSVIRVEVKTPATVVVSAECPKCHMSAVIPAVITAVLEVDDTGGELKLKAKSKKRTHVCGQATLDDAAAAADGQMGFELDDIVQPGDEPAIDPETLSNLLALVLDPSELPTLAAIDGWSEPVRKEVATWAGAVHLDASDNDVEIPPRPEVLDAYRPGLTPGDAPATDGCPFPECIREADHRGRHRIADDGRNLSGPNDG